MVRTFHTDMQLWTKYGIPAQHDVIYSCAAFQHYLLTDRQTDRQTYGRTVVWTDSMYAGRQAAAQADTQTAKLACRQTACCTGNGAQCQYEQNEQNFQLTSLHVDLTLCTCLVIQADA